MAALCATRTLNPGSRTNEEQQNHYTPSDPIEQFKAAMFGAGITPPDDIIGDGQLHRFKIDGKLNGAYVLHLDGRAAGYFQDFKQGLKERWKMAGNFQPLSDLQRQNLAKKRLAAESKRLAEDVAKHAQAAKKAAHIWIGSQYATANHPYLVRKRITPHGAKIGKNNTLIIPLFNQKLELANLQFISPDGGKRFLSGGKKKGCFWQIGEATETILIAEGFATGASLYEATQLLTVVAFDAGNLKEVSMVIRSLYPDAKIVVCGDNDASGVGQEAARVAALAANGKYILPPTPGDFNDHLTGGD